MLPQNELQTTKPELDIKDLTLLEEHGFIQKGENQDYQLTDSGKLLALILGNSTNVT